MEKQFNEKEIKDVRDHVEKATSMLAITQREFLKVIDPSESPETLEYVRKVAHAFDNVILTIFQHENNDEYKNMIHQASEILIQNLIDYHNNNEETH
ncbi:tail length tape-measure protein [Phage NBSal001]|nr:tail length tape-measure protein [Phage NBSal001]